MTVSTKNIESSFSSLCNLVYHNRLKEALAIARSMLEGMHVADFTLQYEDINQTYLMLLEYNFRGVPDPQRSAIFEKLKVSLLELADKIRQYALALTGMHIYQLKSRIEKEKEIAKEEATRNIDNYSFELEFARLLNETDLLPKDSESKSLPAISPKLFQLMWLTDKYTETDILLIKSIRESQSLPWYEKCLAVSAITLSLINCFDKTKFAVLCEFYNEREPQVWQRAFSGIILAVFIYNQRMELYPQLKALLLNYADNETFKNDLKTFLLQIFKALETENITQKFREEILPDVQRFESKIRQKLDIDSLITDELIEDKNPDWEQIFEDSPDLLNKIQKMSEMQMDGLDLFMGTFAMLKNFDFFHEISNWFRPFYKENITAQASVDDSLQGKHDFLASLEDSFYMCNSDKYSFCFNIRNLPDEQGRNVISLFNMEAESMREISKEDGLLNKPGKDVYIFTQYLQDLYRFFKLHPFRADFRDIFSLQWSLSDNWLIQHMNDNALILRTAAEFLFSKMHYAEASELFLSLSQNADASQAVFEKLAYCYQMMGNFNAALEYYKRAELFDTNRLWSLKKIIFCYRKLGNIDEALNWSQQAAALNPDDVYLQTMLGNCYLDLHQFNQALEHYFKVEILSPDNEKVIRPIAWCAFVTGKPDLAKNYLARIPVQEISANDLINMGHVELCLGNKPKAMENYLAALHTSQVNISQFVETLEFDKQFLLGNGINENEIQLIADYIRFKLSGS